MNVDVRRDHVTSRDGTRIGFSRYGHGPGVVLVQGAMATAHQFRELAEALAPDFTVHVPDRRGRGCSPRPFEPDHDIARDVEDVDAVLAETGASRVFGLSSGAVITLEAARTLPRVGAAAVFEPPLYGEGRFDHDGVRRLHAEIERGELPAALVTALRASGTAPAPLRLLPGPVARLLARVALSLDALRLDARSSTGEVTLRDLLPGVRYDFAVVGAVNDRGETFADVDVPVLAISGSRSPAFLRDGARALAGVLPRGRHVELAGLGHSGPWNAARGGRPDAVAAALRPFFA